MIVRPLVTIIALCMILMSSVSIVVYSGYSKASTFLNRIPGFALQSSTAPNAAKGLNITFNCILSVMLFFFIIDLWTHKK